MSGGIPSCMLSARDALNARAAGAGLDSARAGGAAAVDADLDSHDMPGCGGSTGSMSRELQMKTARDLIAKHKVGDEAQYLAISLVGFDSENRDGIPMDGDRCDELLGDIEMMGFDPEEANFGNICVQERPNSTELLMHNRRACAAHEYLADVVSDSMLYGSITHSHLHQCHKNVQAGAPAKLPTTFMVNGKLNMGAVALAQPEFAASIRQGLKWTILHHSIRDVKINGMSACGLIQAAWNRKAGVAMKESSLQAVSRLADICAACCKQDKGEVDFAMAKQAFQSTMPDVADSPEFLGLLRFVVNLGGSRGPFIRDLKTFIGSRGRNRKVKPQVFALAGTLPPSVPHVITGLVVMAITCPEVFVVEGWARFLSSNDVKNLVDKETKLPTEATQSAEKILKWFHCVFDDKNISGRVENAKRLDILSSVDALVCRFITNKHLGKRHDACPSLEHIAESFLKDVAQLEGIDSLRLQAKEKAWVDPDDSKKAPTRKAAKSEEPQLNPRIIEFQDRSASSTQDVHVESIHEELIDWAPKVKYSAEEVVKAQIALQLHAQKGGDGAGLLGPKRRFCFSLRSPVVCRCCLLPPLSVLVSR